MRFRTWGPIVLLAFAGWAGLAATKWLPRPTPAQRKALAVLDAPPTTAIGQHNAFAAIWLWQYDMPDSALQEVADRDVARFGTPDLAHPAHAASSAEGRYRKLSNGTSARAALCVPADPDCLAVVRSHPDATRAAVADNALMLDHVRALAAYDHYHERFPQSLLAPSPSLGGPPWLQLTDAALRFADGDHAEGLARACTATATWRRFALHADHLVVQGFAAVQAVAGARLFAGMLAEIPADAPLPQDCDAAFAPIQASQANVCDAMKTEFRRQASTVRAFSASSRALRLLDNPDATVAAMAPGFATFCTDDADVRDEAMRSARATGWSACGVQGTLFNPVGCRLGRTVDPMRADAGYPERLRNLQAVVTLVRAALALRTAQATGAAPAALPAGVTRDASGMLATRRIPVIPREPTSYAIPTPASRVR